MPPLPESERRGAAAAARADAGAATAATRWPGWSRALGGAAPACRARTVFGQFFVTLLPALVIVARCSG